MPLNKETNQQLMWNLEHKILNYTLNLIIILYHYFFLNQRTESSHIFDIVNRMQKIKKNV